MINLPLLENAISANKKSELIIKLHNQESGGIKDTLRWSCKRVQILPTSDKDIVVLERKLRRSISRVIICLSKSSLSYRSKKINEVSQLTHIVIDSPAESSIIELDPK